jgi:hypothetical protein
MRDEIRRLERRLVTESEPIIDADAIQLQGREDEAADASAMRDDRDAAALTCVACIPVRECERKPRAKVDHSDRVWPDHLHAGFVADCEQTLPARCAFRARASFSESTCHEQAERNAATRRGFDRIERDGDRHDAYHDVDDFRQRVHRRKAREIRDLVVARIDRIHASAVTALHEEADDHAGDLLGLGRSADDGDGTRLEQRLKI